MSEETGYLVTVKVYLLGGHTLELTDAFRAKTGDEAKNFALNTFIQGEGAVVYGRGVVVLDAMCGVVSDGYTSINLDDPRNANYLASIELFERMMDEGQTSDGSGKVDAWAGPEQPQYG